MTEQNINPHLLNEESENTNGITLHDLIQMVLANWYWCGRSTVCWLCAAYYYLASTPKIYSRTATILVKDSRKGGDVDLTAFSDLAGFQNRRNVDNEVYILQSHRLMSEVVKRLHLTVNYSVREGLRTADLYGRSPIEVDFINDNSKQKLSLEVTPLRNGKIELTDFEDKFVTRQETKRVILAEYGDTVATPVGQVVVHKTLFMDSTYLKKPITVIKNSLAATTNAYRAYSREYLTHPDVRPLRDVFGGYELLAYLSIRATQLGLKACEVPVTRAYPATGKTPTKISGFKGNSDLMKVLLNALAGKYNP